MDKQALPFLKAVANAYAELQSLSVDVVAITDIEDQGQRNEHRSRAHSFAPNLVRTEAGRGKTGR